MGEVRAENLPASRISTPVKRERHVSGPAAQVEHRAVALPRGRRAGRLARQHLGAVRRMARDAIELHEGIVDDRLREIRDELGVALQARHIARYEAHLLGAAGDEHVDDGRDGAHEEEEQQQQRDEQPRAAPTLATTIGLSGVFRAAGRVDGIDQRSSCTSTLKRRDPPGLAGRRCSVSSKSSLPRA